MAEQNVLSQDEVDALMQGMKSGAVSTESDGDALEVRAYELGKAARIVRGGMSALQAVNERFVRLHRASLYQMLRRQTPISVGTIQALKLGDYLQRLKMPSSINTVHILPAHGLGLIMLSSEYVFSAVECYFGGRGKVGAVEARDFTAAENRIIQLLLQLTLADIKAAWAHLLPLEMTFQSSESNPAFVDSLSATDTVLVSEFSIELDGKCGELHVLLPYTITDTLRSTLATDGRGDSENRDERWSAALREEIEDADVQLNTLLGNARMSLAELINLKPGDVIPCDFSGKVTVMVEDVPLFRGGYGTSRGQQAVKVEERLGYPRASAVSPSSSRSEA